MEVEEVYDIQPWALDVLQPQGLILCFTWQDDHYRPVEFEDPAAQDVWFANQLSDDACASQAILNVLFNCDVEMEPELQRFKEETESTSSVVCPFPPHRRVFPSASPYSDERPCAL